MKPLGAYGVLDTTTPAPAWVTWSRVPEFGVDRLGRFTAAARLSEARPGFRWVVTLGALPIADYVGEILMDLHVSGLWPHVNGVEFSEEVLSNADAGHFPHLGFPGAHERAQRLEAAWAWVQGVYADIEQWYPRVWKRLWVEHVYNADKRFGLDYWRPCPAEVDIIQIDTYHTGLLSIAVDHALSTQGRDLVLTPQWFVDPHHEGPTAENVALYGRLLERSPRVIGACGYAWAVGAQHHALGGRGLVDLPAWQDPIAESLGVTV